MSEPMTPEEIAALVERIPEEIPARLSNYYPNYWDDPEGLACLRAFTKEARNGHAMAPVNFNTLARLLDTVSVAPDLARALRSASAIIADRDAEIATMEASYAKLHAMWQALQDGLGDKWDTLGCAGCAERDAEIARLRDLLDRVSLACTKGSGSAAVLMVPQQEPEEGWKAYYERKVAAGEDAPGEGQG